MEIAAKRVRIAAKSMNSADKTVKCTDTAELVTKAAGVGLLGNESVQPNGGSRLNIGESPIKRGNTR